jgi:hypothetical protein
MNWLSLDVHAGWADLFVRTVKVLVVSFVVLQAKELFDAGKLDTPATGLDAVMIAVALLVLNAIIKLVKPQ